MLVREVRGVDRLGLVYAAPFPYLLTQDIAAAMPPEKWMVAVVPLALDGALPHQAKIPTEVQRAQAPSYVAALIYRGFFANSKLAFDDLNSQMAGGTEDFNALDLKARKTIEQLKAEAEAKPVATLDETSVQLSCDAALLSKTAILAKEV